MTLDAWAYRNPEQVLMRKQAIEAKKHDNCGDCTHHIELHMTYEVIHRCSAGMSYGYQCTKYRKNSAINFGLES
jgi:hypothetical protein